VTADERICGILSERIDFWAAREWMWAEGKCIVCEWANPYPARDDGRREWAFLRHFREAAKNEAQSRRAQRSGH
jgi:hypothetical protein